MHTSQKNMNAFRLFFDTKLIISIIVLWSFGRIINPLRHFVSEAGHSLGPALVASVVVYVVMHILVLLYVLWLLIKMFRRHGLSIKGKTLGVCVLYLYVLAALLVSLFFIAYEFGYLPAQVQELVPISDLTTES
jgi:hypothetical protein